MPDPRGVDAWIRWEFETLNAGLVIKPRSLRSLLEDASPLRTRDGEPHAVTREVLERFATVCAPAERERLRLPITLHFSADVPDSAYVIDPLAAEALHRLEGWGAAYPFRDGKMWLPQSLAVDLLLRYGGALQRLVL